MYLRLDKQVGRVSGRDPYLKYVSWGVTSHYFQDGRKKLSMIIGEIYNHTQ
jgi:hypothetical protein